MSWLHRLQQRISITRHEALTLISLSLFLILGITGRHACRTAERFGPEAYAKIDSIFARQSAAVFEADPPDVSDEVAAGSSQRTDVSKDTHSAGGTRPPKNAGEERADEEHAGEEHAAEMADMVPANGRIDINHATASDLVRLPRVGPKIAERILAFRRDFGPFHSLDELTSVRGIGPKTLEQIRPHAIVSAEPAVEIQAKADSTKKVSTERDSARQPAKRP